jgi:hypothetical protein
VPIRPELPPIGAPRRAPSPRAPGRSLPAILSAGLLLAGCAQGTPGPGTPSEQARRALAEQRQQGPVRAVVRGNPFGMDEARRDALVSEAMADGVSGLSVRFTTYPEVAAAPEPHLVVVLDPVEPVAAETVCSAPDSVPTTPAGETLSVLAVFCQGDRAVHAVREAAAVAGPTDRRFERLLWRTAGALFPDDYAGSYGFGFLPRWLSFGLGGSFGL